MDIVEIKHKDINVYKLYFSSFLRALLLLNPVILLFYMENGLGIKELFFFQGIFYMTSILLEIPIGYISDRISKKSALLFSYLFFFFPIVLWIFFKGFYPILIGEILFAISKVFFDNANSSYLYDYLSVENRCEEMQNKYAKLNIFLAMGSAISAIAGSFLYEKYGSKIVLLVLLFISILCLFLVSSLKKNAQITSRMHYGMNERIKDFVEYIKQLKSKKYIAYYIYYSGFLTSLSIVFALSFQPLLLKVGSSIFLFGLVAFVNHGIRALFCGLTCKVINLFKIESMIKPLFLLNILAFVFIFFCLLLKNMFVTIILIFLICLIIGVQLMFTIRHVSRLHSLVTSNKRCVSISINNLFSRGTAAIMLFSSKFFIEKIGFENYYLVLFMFFIFIGAFLIFKFNSMKEPLVTN